MLWLVLLVMWIIPCTVSGQSPDDTFSFDFRGEPLQSVIEKISRDTKTDMMYDPKMIGNEKIFKRVRNQSMPGLLSDILEDTPFDYIVLSSGTIVMVRKVSEDPDYGTFSGLVRDSWTGKPLHGATVLLADASGGTSTNRNGNFNIGQMMSGSYRIIISYVGYKPVERVIEIRPFEQVETEISLEPATLTFMPVVVRAHRPNLAGIDSRIPVNSLELRGLAGGRRDALRNLNLFSGLQYGLPMQDIHLQGGRQGEHRVRLDGIPVYNPYHFGHFFSAFSPIAISDIQLHTAGFGAEQGSMISGIIDFQHDIPYKNQTNVQLLGDPVNVNLRGNLRFPTVFWTDSPTFESSEELTEVSDRASSEETSNVSYLTSSDNTPEEFVVAATVRSNFWNLYKEPAMHRTLMEWDYVDPLLTNHILNSGPDILEYQPLKQNSDLRYFDGHFAFRYEPDKFNIIRTSLYFGKNQISSSHLWENVTGSGVNNYLFTLDQFKGEHLVGQISWDTSPGPRLNIFSQIGVSTNRMNQLYHLENRKIRDPRTSREISLESNGNGSTEELFDAFYEQVTVLPSHAGSNSIDHNLVQSRLTYSFTPELQFESGLELNLISSNVDFSEFFYRQVHVNENSAIGATFFNFNWQIGKYWKMTSGYRVTRTDTHEEFFWEPRVSLQYDHTDSRIGYWSGRIAGGVYRQFVHQYEITNVGPTSMIPSSTVWSHGMTTEPPKAYHLSGSWIYKPLNSTSLKLESYYKWEPTGYISSHSPLLGYTLASRFSAESFSESTRLQSWGASARVNHQLPDARANVMFGYDYSHAEIEMSQYGRILPAYWNEPHRIHFQSVFHMTSQISLIANWKSVYGRAWGFRQAYYDFLYLEGVREVGEFTFDDPENDKLSPFHQLDLSLLYRPPIKLVHLDFRLDFINVLNRRNVIDWSLQAVPREHNSENESQGFDYEIRERTMPGFYPTFRIALRY